MDVIFLPATEPGDTTFGQAPQEVPIGRVHHVRFPHLVWYNKAYQAATVQQIQRLTDQPFLLIGFSKSGLGAWNIIDQLGPHLQGVLIFDAPMARQQLPPWGTQPFYQTDADWLADLPIRNAARLTQIPDLPAIVLTSGSNFHDEMAACSDHLQTIGLSHTFDPQPDRPHHWTSGWLENGIELLMQQIKQRTQ